MLVDAVFRTKPLCLFAENFFYLSDFLLDFPAYLFSLAFSLEIWVVRQLACFFLHFPLQVVKLSLCFILDTWLHWVAPLKKPDQVFLTGVPLPERKGGSNLFSLCRLDARICIRCPGFFPSFRTVHCNIFQPSRYTSSL